MIDIDIDKNSQPEKTGTELEPTSPTPTRRRASTWRLGPEYVEMIKFLKERLELNSDAAVLRVLLKAEARSFGYKFPENLDQPQKPGPRPGSKSKSRSRLVKNGKCPDCNLDLFQSNISYWQCPNCRQKYLVPTTF